MDYRLRTDAASWPLPAASYCLPPAVM